MYYSACCFVGGCTQQVVRVKWASFDPQPYVHPKFGVVSSCLDHGRDLVKCGLPPSAMTAPKRCEANAKRGTGTGMCDQPLDSHGECPRAGDHL